MINLRVDDETAIPLSVDSPSAVSMTVSEAFIDHGGSAIQNNKNATPSTSQVVVTPDQGFDALAKVTVAAMPQGEIDPASLSYDTYLLRGRITAEANVTQAGYVPIGGNVARAYCDELLPSENPKTVTPTTSEQTAVAANKWTKGAIKVGAIPPEYIVPTGTKSISANGTGIDVKAYEKVDVAVPGVVPSGTLAIATNGSHDVTNYATAAVAVPASAVDSGTKAITANGNGQDVVGYAAVNVNVPNSYAAADEGKVVSNGALVAQTSDTCTTNGVVDTTLINSLDVNVSGSSGKVLLASETAASDVQAMTISYDAATMAAYDYFEIEIEGKSIAGKAFYPCAQLNGTSAKVYNGYVGGNTNFHFRFPVAPYFQTNGTVQGHRVSIGGSSNQVATNGAITSFDVVSYYSDGGFKTGSTMKVWGIPT